MTSPIERNETDNKEAVIIPGEGERPAKISTTEKVRQGHSGDGLSKILALSLIGAVVALFIAYFVFF